MGQAFGLGQLQGWEEELNKGGIMRVITPAQGPAAVQLC